MTSTDATRPPTVFALNSATTNAELMVYCRDLGYLTNDKATLDATWGLGRFWKLWAPDLLIGNDLVDTKAHNLRSSFTALPFANRSIPNVVFDPPYKMCLDDETQILTRRGWLTCDEVTTDDLAYSLDHATGRAEWKRITSINIYDRELSAVHVCDGKNLDFVATGNHRWPVLTGNGVRTWKTSATLARGDRVIHSAAWSGAPSTSTLTDAFVELVAWFWTEGTYDSVRKSGRSNSTYGSICQSHQVNAANCERITSAFEDVYGPSVERFERSGRLREGNSVPRAWRVHEEERNTRFIFSAAIGRELLEWAPDKVPSLEFFELLTPDQLELFIQVSILADAQNPGMLAQANPEAAKSFALACILSGRAVSLADDRGDGNGTSVRIKSRHYSKPSRPGVQRELRVTRVWCPTVEDNSTWLARRGLSVYFTGNSGRAGTHPSDEGYGVAVQATAAQRLGLIGDGCTECMRVASERCFVKSQDQVCSGDVAWQTDLITAAFTDDGWVKEDALFLRNNIGQPKRGRCTVCSEHYVLTRSGEWRTVRRTLAPIACPDGCEIEESPQQHARRNYSTLLVFRRTSTP